MELVLSSRDSVQVAEIQRLKKCMPTMLRYAFGFIRSLEHPEIIYNTERQWFERLFLELHTTFQVTEQDIQVMLKPQIWIWQGEYTGYLQMKSEEEWLQLESSYRDFILSFAHLAAEFQVPVFCINRIGNICTAAFCILELITEIRMVYTESSLMLQIGMSISDWIFGKTWIILELTPISYIKDKTPSVATASASWQTWKDELQNISSTFGKPILFTEYGYRSVDYAGDEPWQSSREIQGVNISAQNNLLQALYESLWYEEWFVGGFL